MVPRASRRALLANARARAQRSVAREIIRQPPPPAQQLAEIQHEADLEELAGLELHKAKIEPAPRAEVGDAERAELHERHQQQAGEERRRDQDQQLAAVGDRRTAARGLAAEDPRRDNRY